MKMNSVTFSGKNPGIDEYDVEALLKPKPNNRFLGIFPIKIWLYNFGATRKNQEKKTATWLREGAGERPVIFDSLLAVKSQDEVLKYLDKIGYYHSDITFSTKLKRKRAWVKYTITPSKPYILRNIDYRIEDSVLRDIILRDTTESLIKSGMIFNAFTLESERTRISQFLRNHGYYFFNPNYIFYEIDSSLNSRQFDLFLKVKKQQLQMREDPGRFREIDHKQFTVNRIIVNTDYDPFIGRDDPSYDTVSISLYHIRKDRHATDYSIIFRNKLLISPKIIAQSVFINQGDLFSNLDVTMTQSRIAELGLFNLNDIRFRPTQDSTFANDHRGPFLDCHIDLSRRKLNSFTVETEGTNSGGALGIGVNFAFQNKNLFRGAELFDLRLKTSLEFQQDISKKDVTEPATNNIFSTKMVALEARLSLPKFLIPVRPERFPKYFRPKTSIIFGPSYEERTEYTRWINNLSFGYEWKESKFKSHMFYPLDVNSVNVSLSQSFQDTINTQPSDRVRNQYSDHLVMAMKYSFIFNNQEFGKIKNFFYFRGNIEPAGNLLYLLSSPLNMPEDSAGSFLVTGVPFSQFIRFDGDLRHYKHFARDNWLATRLFFGIGIPYGNVDQLPLENGFYGGGSNGLRAWRLRLVGPGSYSDEADPYDRMGDLQLEFNAEYRFPVYSFFELALFADLGNIWLLKDDATYPGGKFEIHDFYNELAIDAGLGIRFDFKYFLIRLDGAFKMHNPALPEGNRWMINEFQIRDVLWNLGIGYPF